MITYEISKMTEKEIRAKEKQDGCDVFEQQIIDNFNELVGINTPLYLTDAYDLWDTYLENIDEKHRQFYNCNACRHFIERFGSMVTVNENGEMKSVIWGFEAPELFKESVNKMREKVEKSRIRKVFISDELTLGTPKTGIWTHIAVELPEGKTNKSRLYTAGQVMAEKTEDYRMLSRAIEKYSLETVNTAVELLNSETLYRGDKCLGVAKWFKQLKEIIAEANNSKQKENYKWLAVATAPTGFTHISSSMIGTLLDDIQEGMSYQLVSRRFADKMNPNNYMRSQSAPTTSAIVQAEKKVMEMGIADSLERRYATLDEIPNLIWKDKKVEKKQPTQSNKTSIFGNLTPKERIGTTTTKMDLPMNTMTWEKFVRTVLPTASTIEAKLDNPNRLMALVTAVHPNAENILQWDNTFSWYYHGGIDAEMKKRVESAGGQYEDNDIRCSLMWNNITDLDLHCITPFNREIYFGVKRQDGGYLDVDMNVYGESTTPVENIRFKDGAHNGRYRFIVENYTDRNHGTNPFKVELEVNGQVFCYEGDCGREDKRITVFDFEYVDGKITKMYSDNINQFASSNDWNVESNEFIKVNGITNSPNLWGDKEVAHAGTHMFFLLDGCKDTTEGLGRGFFNEMLKPEIRDIRKVLEAYMAQAPIQGAENATACGLGFSKDSEWNLILRVTSDNNSTRLVKIDRWD